MIMTWEQKLLALKALGGSDTALHIRTEGDWYVRVPGVEIKEGPVLRGAGGSGETPEEAVENTWNGIAGRELVVKAMGPGRASFRWNGFMWESIAPNVEAA
jgi:hypothetical protein